MILEKLNFWQWKLFGRKKINVICKNQIFRMFDKYRFWSAVEQTRQNNKRGRVVNIIILDEFAKTDIKRKRGKKYGQRKILD